MSKSKELYICPRCESSKDYELAEIVMMDIVTYVTNFISDGVEKAEHFNSISSITEIDQTEEYNKIWERNFDRVFNILYGSVKKDRSPPFEGYSE